MGLYARALQERERYTVGLENRIAHQISEGLKMQGKRNKRMDVMRSLSSAAAGLVLLLTGARANEATLPKYNYSLPLKTVESSDELVEKDSKPYMLFDVEKVRSVPKKDYRTDNFYNDSDDVLLARMLLGEAEDCSDLEKISIAWTVLNRMDDGKKWNGTTLQEVILKPMQYSAFNPDLNAKLKNPLAYNPGEFYSSLNLAREILAGKYSDPTNGATHYLNPNHPDLRERALPAWTRSMARVGRIGNSYHTFYKEV